MRLILGLIVGLVIGGGVGFGLGYNKGRGAPLLTNPFQEYTLADDFERRANKLIEDTRKAIHDATE